MNLYIWRPQGHGEDTYMVCAESLHAACIAIFADGDAFDEINQSRRLLGRDYYKLEVYEPGELARNHND